jgi:pSer/pThr/pTyr-binding forkhead associated (FHA) protein
MAELFLKFEDQVLQELLLSGGTVTIGRQPDNVFRIDNPAVSGHHAKVYAEGDHYVIEDVESFNGTYVNGQRISKDGTEGRRQRYHRQAHDRIS